MAEVTCPFGCPWRIDHDDQTALAAHIAAHNQPLEEAPVPDSLPCKIPGCNEPRLDAAGMYAALCATHKAEKKAARTSAASKLAAVPNGHAPTTLPELAQAVELSRKQLAQAFKALADEVARQMQAV